jgi:hypothetical protein
LCITAKMRPDVSCGSRLCENPEVAKTRRMIFLRSVKNARA